MQYINVNATIEAAALLKGELQWHRNRGLIIIWYDGSVNDSPVSSQQPKFAAAQSLHLGLALLLTFPGMPAMMSKLFSVSY